uniref:Major facilitator superfamily (MFS) profile domain-containing protein n=1 Tax=Knipowitschia caucasica TaxID=637954 RepID=A0AAV2KUK9_KNICA
MTQKQPTVEGPDGGWGWVLVAALFVCNSMVFGLMRIFGIFFVEFVHYFDESAQAISWISSIGLAVQQCFSPLGAALGNAYGARVVVMVGGFLSGLGLILASQATSVYHLYLTMGVISGFGWSLVFTPMMATVMAHFTRRRTLALGGLSLNIIPCGALIMPQKHSVTTEKTERKASQSVLKRLSSYLELSVLLERPFFTFVLCLSLMNVGYFVPYFHLVAHSRQVGFSEYQAAFAVSASGGSDIVGRIASGWFSDLGHFRLLHLQCFWTMLCGLSIVLLPVSTLSGSYPALVCVSILYGFFSGASTAVIFSAMPHIVGVGRVMGALGLLQMIESGAGLFGTPLSGFLRDITGDFIASFAVAGSFLILACLILTTLPHFFSCTDPPPPNKQPSEQQAIAESH